MTDAGARMIARAMVMSATIAGMAAAFSAGRQLEAIALWPVGCIAMCMLT